VWDAAVFSSHRKVARAFLVPHGTDSPWRTCGSRKRDALVAQKDFFTEGNERNKVGKVSSTEGSEENEDCDLSFVIHSPFGIRASSFS
jgi:hypothetical protein